MQVYRTYFFQSFSFMEHALRIGSGPDYIPTTTDVLRARAKSVGIAETRYVTFEFFLPFDLVWRGEPLSQVSRTCAC
jgi:hypothetical protein